MKIYSENEIDKLVEILKNDGVISVPTDTVFGVCARINSKIALNKLIEIKHRPKNKIFPIMCANIEQIKEIAIVDNKVEDLIRAFMPGPITLVLNKNPKFDGYINSTNSTIAIRMATSELLERMISKLGTPLYMSSANLSREPVCKNLDEIEKSCPNLDGMLEGTVKYNISSTIVNCSNNDFEILREGPISKNDILKTLNN